MKYNNINSKLIQEVCDAYVQEAGFQESSLWILTGQQSNDGKVLYLDNLVVNQLGILLASQLRRYFIDRAAGIATSLPRSPIRNGYIRLSEHSLWSHLMKVGHIVDYIDSILRSEDGSEGGPKSALVPSELAGMAPGWLLTKLITPLGNGINGNITTATIAEMSDLKERLANDSLGDCSSSDFLMQLRGEAATTIAY
ncbi:hypothetical protein BGZ83_004679, partial [Gryganskiella cystojenkinii]